MIKVESCGWTDVGKVRTHNEDRFLIADLSQAMRADSNGPADFVLGRKGSLFMVSDGVGGAAAGEIASQLCVQAVYDRLSQGLDDRIDPPWHQVAQKVLDAINYSNAVVHDHSRSNPRLSGMAATLTAALVRKENLLVGQIGDSRAYLIRRGEMTKLTKDQSLVQQMIDAGELTEEEGRTFPKRNLLLQALGVNPTVETVLTQYKLCQGDYLLLCSDGLHALVPAPEIVAAVEKSGRLERACARLIEAANAGGGPDNITVVLARFSGDTLAPPGPSDSVVYTKFQKPKTTQRFIIPAEPEPAAAAGPEAPAAAPPKRSNIMYWLLGIFVLVATLLLLILRNPQRPRGTHNSDAPRAGRPDGAPTK